MFPGATDTPVHFPIGTSVERAAGCNYEKSMRNVYDALALDFDI